MYAVVCAINVQMYQHSGAFELLGYYAATMCMEICIHHHYVHVHISVGC